MILSPPSSIDDTGREDVSLAVSEWISGLPSGSTVVFRADQTFRVESGVYPLGDAESLTVENHATWRQYTDGSGVDWVPTERSGRTQPHWPRPRAMFSWDGYAGLTLLGSPHLIGSHPGGHDGIYDPDLEAQHGYNLKDCTNLTFHQPNVYGVAGDGIWTRGCECLFMTNPEAAVIRHVGRQGIAVVSGAFLTFDGWVVDDVRRSAFDAEPLGASTIDALKVRYGRASRYRLTFFAAGSRNAVNHVELVDNRAIGTLKIKAGNVVDGVVRSDRRTNWIVSGNVGTDLAVARGEGAMQFAGIDQLEVRENWQGIRARVGVAQIMALRDCPGAVVDGNHFPVVSDKRGQVVDPQASATVLRA